jgi:hypothetical protein
MTMTVTTDAATSPAMPAISKRHFHVLAMKAACAAVFVLFACGTAVRDRLDGSSAPITL